MRIKATQLEYTHTIMSASKNEDEYSQGENENENEPSQKCMLDYTGDFAFCPIELPSPLEDLTLVIRRRDISYNVRAILLAREGQGRIAFENLSEQLRLEIANKTKLHLFPSSSDGSGLILDDQNRIPFTIYHGGERTRIISLGSFGAYLRTFPERYGTFKSEIESLEEIVNIYLTTCLEIKQTAVTEEIKKAVLEIVPA